MQQLIIVEKFSIKLSCFFTLPLKVINLLMPLFEYLMRPKFSRVWLILLVLSFSSCGNSEQELDIIIKRALRNDSTLTDTEWNEIIRFIDQNEDIVKYKSGDELCLLIDKIALGLSKNERNPLNYPPTVKNCFVDENFNTLDTFNVYLENSASMDGYMNGLTEFKGALYHMLTEIKGKDKQINFAFINKETHDFDTDEINDFIDYLQPSKMRGMGNRGDTELNHILRLVLEQYEKDDNPIILISDFIFSVKGLKSVDGDLPRAKYTLKAEIQKMDKTKNAILVIKYFSKFKGKYYDFKNRPSKIDNDDRPYYIWIIGSNETVYSFVKDYVIKKSPGFNDYFIIANESAFDAPYNSILRDTEKQGRFSLCRNEKNCIKDIQFSTRSNDVLQFSIALDLSSLPVADNYKLDKDNFTVESFRESEFLIEKILSIKDILPNDERYQGAATHIVVLNTTKEKLSVRDQTVKLKFRNTIPGWVKKSSTLDDSNILSRDDLKDKTFGFEYLVTGAFEALNSPDLDNCFFWEVPIRIKNE